MTGPGKKRIEALLAPLASDPCLVRYDEETSSTMTSARELIAHTDSGPCWGVALARRQTAGRGRLANRSWVSMEGNLHVTFLRSLPVAEAHALSGLSLVVACSVARVFENLGVRFLLKWPNDLLSPEKKKVGGILVELVQKNGVWIALIGLGLNLAHAPHGGSTIGDCSENAVTLLPEKFVSYLMPVLKEDLEVFEASGFAVFRDRWLGYSGMRGDLLVTVGEEKVMATFLGITDAGALVVNHAGKVLQIASGEIIDF